MQGKIAMSAQDTISYKEMRPDGICRVTDKFYTKTIQFLDINYQLARNEDKNIIFENYCDFLNYFDKSISVQLSFLNQSMDISEYEKAIDIKSRNDEFDDIRTEYAEMLKSQLARGNNGIVRKKYITFGIEADNIQNAKQRLSVLRRIYSIILRCWACRRSPCRERNALNYCTAALTARTASSILLGT